MKGEILQIKKILPHWETDHTETVISRLVAAIVYDFLHPDGCVEELTTGIRPAQNNAFNLRVIEAAQRWLDAGGTIPEYVPPTAEELRLEMVPLTARQFRLGLINTRRTLSQVEDAIAGIEDEVERSKALVEWEYAAKFERLHPLVVSISSVLGFAPEEVDTLWENTLNL